MRLTLFACCLLLISCGGKSGVPKDVLQPPQMTEVLWDVMRADEMVSMNYPLDTGTVRFDTSIVLYRQIAQQHKITQAKFKESLQFYKTRPDLMQVILDTLNNRTTLPPAAADSTMKDSLSIQ